MRRLPRKYMKIDTPLADEVTETLINLLSSGKYEDDWKNGFKTLTEEHL